MVGYNIWMFYICKSMRLENNTTKWSVKFSISVYILMQIALFLLIFLITEQKK